MKTCILAWSLALALVAPRAAAGQIDEQAPAAAPASPSAQKPAATRNDDPPPGVRFVRTLTNVQVELNLTDHIGTQAPEKKTVSMIVSSGNWGKIRSAGNMSRPGEVPVVVDLNVDARPFVTVDGQVQLELTLVYSPPVSSADSREGPKLRPTGINQSQTVVLQSGKAMVISQAADPVTDRKVVVEVKATVLK